MGDSLRYAKKPPERVQPVEELGRLGGFELIALPLRGERNMLMLRCGRCPWFCYMPETGSLRVVNLARSAHSAFCEGRGPAVAVGEL